MFQYDSLIYIPIFRGNFGLSSMPPPRMTKPCNPSVKGGKMTGGRTRVVFGETLCLAARSPASRSLAEGRRFGEGRAAPLPV